MNKPVVGVFFGSRSAEHDVSIVTAISSIIKPLALTKKFEIVPVYIAKDGKWYSHPKLMDIKLFTSGKIDTFLAKADPVAVRFDGGLTLVWPKLRNRFKQIDVAFPATHGTHGEDGELMAIFEMASIPYVGCGPASSAVAMDKVLAKQVAMADGVPTNKWQWFSADEFIADRKGVLKELKGLKYPLFVKPAHLGSSIGISRAKNLKELENAIEVAAEYDDKIIVEEEVPNLIEVTLPIMGNDEPRPALLERPLLKAEDFFDFDTKYMQGGKKGEGGGKSGKRGAQGYSQVPAQLPKKLYDSAQDIGLATYVALGCSGTARIDMLIDSKKNKVYFNEINPLPGSLYSHNWQKAGVSNVQLVLDLIRLAQERYEARAKKTTVFNTNFLKQF